MLKFFEFLGYQVKDASGKTNYRARILDALLFSAYFILSLINLFNADPSFSMIVLNIITMGRLLLKNHFEQSAILKVYTNTSGDYTKFTLMHLIKIIIEAMVLILVLVFICANYFSGQQIVILVKVFAGIVLLFTWIDNLLAMFEHMYDAQPMPLSYFHNA